MKRVSWGLVTAGLLMMAAYFVAGSPKVEIRLINGPESGGIGTAHAASPNVMDTVFTQTVEKANPGMVMVICEQAGSLGTGMILNTGGSYYIASNRHVVWDEKNPSKSCGVGSNVTIQLWTQDKFPGKVVYIDDTIDMSIIEPSTTTFMGKPLPNIPVGDPLQLKVGQWVLAIGNPKGLTNSASAGIISAYRPWGRGDVYLQTDAAINPGNSGGPLVNLSGEVIGMNTLKLSDVALEGLGFAIPIDIVVARIPRGGKFYQPPMLGVHVETLDSERARALGVQPGALSVSRIEPGSAAETAGLESGDIIVGTDRGVVQSEPQLWHYLATKWAGDDATLKVQRRGQKKTITVKLGRRGAALVNLASLGLQCSSGSGGVAVSNVTREGAAANAGLQPGDVIVRVGADNNSMAQVSSPADLEGKLKGVANSQDYAMLEVQTAAGARRYYQIYFTK